MDDFYAGYSADKAELEQATALWRDLAAPLIWSEFKILLEVSEFTRAEALEIIIEKYFRNRS